jgi:putative heme-binding domain-containing protein
MTLPLLALVVVLAGGCRPAATPPSAGAPPPARRPSRETIARHLDTSVRVFGRYAVVKLPIRSGVTIWNPAYLASGPDGVIYAANLTGEIYTLRDTDGDGLEDRALLYHDVKSDGVRAPTAMVVRGRELYVGTPRGVRAYADRDGDGRADTSRVVFAGAPYSEHPYEWTSALTFGPPPDDHLYMVLATDSWNAGASPDPQGWRGSLLRIAPGGAGAHSAVERVATGVRSVHGMAFDAHGTLFFADNQGGGNADEELNVARAGAFYGHNPAKYGNPPVTPPLLALRTEVAPAGMAFRPPGNDLDGTAGELFVAFYGPGERWTRGAIGRVRIERRPDGSVHATEFPVATGLAKIADLDFGPDGDIYAAQVGRTDYWYQPLDTPDGAIYRLIPAPWVEPAPIAVARAAAAAAPADVLAWGRQLFAERSCSACHAVDGTTELLGPNLRDVGRVYSRDELLEEIRFPSRRIKPGEAPTRITRRDGTVLLGRVLAADARRVRIMVVGNRVVDVPRDEIRSEARVTQSLMPEGLLATATPAEVDALLAYLADLHRGAAGR